MSREIVISVIGAGNNAPREAVEMAEAVGRELAKRGAAVICGGLNGVMEAVCRGAKSEGGVTIGVLPGDDPDSANSFVDFPVPTGMGHARNAIVVKAGLAVIAVDGAYGTLSEIGHALAEGKTVIGLKTWRISQEDNEEHTAIVRAGTPWEAVELALQAAANRSKAGVL